MIEFPWLKVLPWGIAALMAFAAVGSLHLYQSERDDFTEYKAKVEQIAKDQAAQVALLIAQGDDNLNSLKAKYEADLPAVRDTAVRNYILWMRQQSTVQPVNRPDASGKQVDDGAEQKPMDDSTAAVIGNCGEDARKLEAWIEYCTVNHCPVK